MSTSQSPCTVRSTPARSHASRQAQRQARLHRDELVRQTGEPRRRRTKSQRSPPYKINASRANESGVIGVCTDGLSWIAFYSPRPGVQRKKAFSIRKHGDFEALTLAAEWRKANLKRLR